ncbi:FkbM family methyltransferase [Streptomyces sp. NBC_01304]|uniref:FkbM family methyltransferase n=1 Tax=Streptomyces sp. NBC_01304 TaxID=2903818 RepID=UPI002E12BEAE|nr:FkbM family methyltransferase [Streptomyces sp. NBC_01304]
MTPAAVTATGTGTAPSATTALRDLILRTPGAQRAVRAAADRDWLPPSVWARLQPSGVWPVRAPDGSTFRYACGEDDALARSVVWTHMRHWEETTCPVFFELARKARRFVDIGAYSGIYTLLACRANPDLTAVAVEPNPAARRLLVRNVEVNGLERRVRVCDKALSDTSGRTRLAIPADVTAASLLPPRGAHRSVDVEVVTGDGLLGTEPVDLVKIDVEGLEAQVLRGMERVLRAHHPALVVECLDAAALEAVRSTAHDFGYRRVTHLSSTGPVPAVPGTTPLPRYANFLLTQD